MTPMRTRVRWLDWPGTARWAVTFSFFAAVNWLLLAPAQTFHDIHVFLACQDKIAHASIFLTLSLLVRWSSPAAWWRGWVQAVVLGALALYAGTIEVFQPLLTKAGRYFEWLDMASNFAGVIAGWVGAGALAVREQPDGPRESSPGETRASPTFAKPGESGL